MVKTKSNDAEQSRCRDFIFFNGCILTAKRQALRELYSDRLAHVFFVRVSFNMAFSINIGNYDIFIELFLWF
jgi:hypothetical protein